MQSRYEGDPLLPFNSGIAFINETAAATYLTLCGDSGKPKSFIHGDCNIIIANHIQYFICYNCTNAYLLIATAELQTFTPDTYDRARTV